MAQVFGPAANTRFRVVLALLPAVLAGLGIMLYGWSRSGAAWNVNEPAPQPIPYRHDLHTGALGIACGYCHTSADRAAHAGMPSAETCLSCHAQLWVGASVLQPLWNSRQLDQPVAWFSLNRLPSYARFHHAAHVSKGVACETCHGDMTQMPKTVRAETLSMGWCLDCHREPERYLSPAQAAQLVGLPASAAGAPDGPRLYENGPVQDLYEAARRHLTSCSTCHR